MPYKVAKVIEAHWLPARRWFYECPACVCSFGMLRATIQEAERDARAHDAEDHLTEFEQTGMTQEELHRPVSEL